MTVGLESEIGAAVRAAMQERGISQSKLGEHLDLPQPSISRRLSGEIPFTAPELVRTAELLELPAAQFLPSGERAA